MVFVLDKASQYEHFEPKSRKELIAYQDESSDSPKKKYPQYLYLATFIDLYRARKKHLPKDVAMPELYRDLERLNDLRNRWTHFKVDGWSLEAGLPGSQLWPGSGLWITYLSTPRNTDTAA